jgi:hypothetical protein
MGVLMSNCLETQVMQGCYNGDTPVAIHYIYSKDAAGLTVLNTVITNAAGAVVAGASASNTLIGVCQAKASQPHVFSGVNIPALKSIWTLPITASSPVSRFQVTVRDALGSDISVRVLAISSTQFSIDATVALSGVSIFVDPIKTLS